MIKKMSRYDHQNREKNSLFMRFANSTMIAAAVAGSLTFGAAYLSSEAENRVEKCRIATEFLMDDKSDNGVDENETEQQILKYDEMRRKNCS